MVDSAGVVDDLREAIFAKLPKSNGFAAKDLLVWRVAIPLTNGALEAEDQDELLSDAKELVAMLSLKEVLTLEPFKSLDPNHLHILVRTPEGS